MAPNFGPKRRRILRTHRLRALRESEPTGVAPWERTRSWRRSLSQSRAGIGQERSWGQPQGCLAGAGRSAVGMLAPKLARGDPVKGPRTDGRRSTNQRSFFPQKETAARDTRGAEASEDRLGPVEWFLSGKRVLQPEKENAPLTVATLAEDVKQEPSRRAGTGASWVPAEESVFCFTALIYSQAPVSSRAFSWARAISGK